MTSRNIAEKKKADNIERFEKLIKSVQENSFDRLHIPILTFDNIILDGQHRSCILYHLYGGDFVVPCLMLKLKKKRKESFLSKVFSIKDSIDKVHKTIIVLGIRINFKEKNCYNSSSFTY